MSTKPQTQPVDDFDFSIAEGTNQDYLDVYPRIQFQHGSRQLSKLGNVVAHTGGLFVPADQFPNFSAEGWVEDSFITSKNEEIKGYSSVKAYLAILRVKTWWPEGEGSKTHMLCCIRGVDGLFSLQVGGISKGQPMLSAFTAHRNQIVAMVNRTKPPGTRGFEPYAMWFVVEPGPHETQASKGDSSKASEVTKPRLYTPENVDLAYARTLWVGKENYQLFCQLYKDTEPWQKQFPKSQSQSDDHSSDTPGFSGPSDSTRMSQGQLDMIEEMMRIKNIDESELQQMCLTATNGGSSGYRTLSREAADYVIDTMKSF